MGELAEALVLDRSALGHTLRPLERDGLVAFRASPTDKRRTHVVLTPAGRARHRSARRLWERGQAHFEQVVGALEARALRETLLAIAADDRLAGIGRGA